MQDTDGQSPEQTPRPTFRDEGGTAAAPAPSAPLHASLPAELRPRELMERFGCKSLSDDQLLAILLRSGTRGLNVVELSRAILRRYGSLRELSKATPTELEALGLPGLGHVKCLELSAALEITRRVLDWRDPDERMDAPEAIARRLASLIEADTRETFFVFPLNRRSRLIGSPVAIARGTVDTVLAHPREVFREAVRLSASTVVVAHNHPSGDPTPSAADLSITRELVAAGRILRIPLLDHVVVGRPAAENFRSLRRSKLVEFD